MAHNMQHPAATWQATTSPAQPTCHMEDGTHVALGRLLLRLLCQRGARRRRLRRALLPADRLCPHLRPRALLRLLAAGQKVAHCARPSA